MSRACETALGAAPPSGAAKITKRSDVGRLLGLQKPFCSLGQVPTWGSLNGLRVRAAEIYFAEPLKGTWLPWSEAPDIVSLQSACVVLASEAPSGEDLGCLGPQGP